MQRAPVLPKGWPPLGPSAEVTLKIRNGKILSESELDQLRQDGARAERLEATDPDYLRAVRRYRAQMVEEDRILEVQEELEGKTKVANAIRERVQRQRAAKADRFNRRRKKLEASRHAVDAAREEKRAALVEHIAVTERRALVRDTIQRALISQSRSDGHSERVMFTDPKMLGDVPGPGAHDVPPPDRGPGTRFNPLTTTEARTRPLPRPGPGSYDPKYAGGPSITMGGLHESRRAIAALPGPGEYHTEPPVRKGGVISRHRVKSELEFALERAREQPGPGAYELTQLAPGKSSTISGRTRGASDAVLMQAARRPGPGTYEVPKGRVRGGVMALDSRREPSLPVIVPGPGAYMQTPTIRQEQELRELSKQVVRIVKNRQSSRSAPEALGGAGRGRRARAHGGLSATDLAEPPSPRGSGGYASASALQGVHEAEYE